MRTTTIIRSRRPLTRKGGISIEKLKIIPLPITGICQLLSHHGLFVHQSGDSWDAVGFRWMTGCYY